MIRKRPPQVQPQVETIPEEPVPAWRQLTLAEAILGLVVSPRETIDLLFSSPKDPPHALSILAVLVTAIMAPVAIQLLRWNFLHTRIDIIGSLLLVFLVTGLFFVILEKGLLVLFGFDVDYRQIAAAFSYGCAPVVVLALIYYLADLILFQRITIVTFMITGVPDALDWTMPYFPLFHLAAKALFLMIFFGSMRKVLAEVGDTTVFVIALGSCIPFYAALFSAIYLAELVYPGTLNGIEALVLSLAKVLTHFH